ncbi:hypothetical protein [Sphaerisporangium fuscum]|uniref:hypothetical protein n=1 Tax=Sphaerisporangium fuscum TaxID=2835868 RepID=UPI001BDD7DB3|nr:hypothetical protein [Sphaerisporangium fuscum]
MVWIYVAVGLGVAGLVPIAVLSVRVLVAMRGLTREIERTTRRLEPVRAQFARSDRRIKTVGGVNEVASAAYDRA